MPNPIVSVVIVTYNKADTVGTAIESVLHQTYQDFEILVVDDGSTDGTVDRVRAYGNRVRLFQKTNEGTGSARNLGIAEARGQYVAFLDGDDLWLPAKLASQMAVFEREPDVIAVQCSAYCVNDALEVLEVRACDPRRDALLNFLLWDNLPAFASAVVVRKECLIAVGGFGTDLVASSDWDMAVRLARRGTLRSVPEFLVLYRQYPGNQSHDIDIHVEAGVRSRTRFFADPTLDPAIRAKESWVWARFYAMLAGGYFHKHHWTKSVHWAWKAVRTSPRVSPYVAGMPIRRIRRALKRPRPRSLAHELPFAVLTGLQ